MRKENQAIFTDDKKALKPAGWDGAIAEAERQIAKHEQRITKLRLAVGTFQEMKERGEPFMPETKAVEIAA